MSELFRQGEFWIDSELEDRVNAESWVNHSCEAYMKQAANAPVYELLESEMLQEQCSFCDKKIPPGVLALWRLHNWDRKLSGDR